jgi:hypothetical protein
MFKMDEVRKSYAASDEIKARDQSAKRMPGFNPRLFKHYSNRTTSYETSWRLAIFQASGGADLKKV